MRNITYKDNEDFLKMLKDPKLRQEKILEMKQKAEKLPKENLYKQMRSASDWFKKKFSY